MKKLDHVGIAVSSIEAVRGFYERMLGLTYMGDELVSGQNVRVAFLEAGGTKLELIEPLSDASPVSSFLQKRGEGLHHLAFRCADMKETIKELEACRMTLIHHEPQKGAGGKKIAFLSPKEANGVLIELCETIEKGETQDEHE
ncbi:methylmalonyl-CoA epimerase [Bacillus velezensis]|uniref:methylmalonyl-CoA epimerase n=1 Tax=Bacillus velezensis TaxID=492670 RepID=UPI00285CB4D9|nr:methylmalonyl-CoA epimerase [Bacillus velezensis]MDR7909175.1 methylmalonyl-CoA epimerase [Bacillus velezensis]